MPTIGDSSARPARDISEALLDYARPLIDNLGGRPVRKEMDYILRIAFTVWNGVVFDTVCGNDHFVSRIREMAAGDLETAELMERMIRRKRTEFGDDQRLVRDCRLVSRDGKWCIHAEESTVLSPVPEKRQTSAVRRTPRTRRRPPAAPAPVYQLGIVLNGSDPAIWRRLQVPGDANLGWLHAVIQLAMGWTNSHLHQFVIGGQAYSDPSFGQGDFVDSPKILNENRAVLARVLPHEGDTMVYEYDYGDGWRHAVAVEKILPPDPAVARTARCVDGGRACPPDDCGGLGGYADLIRILADPQDKEHDRLSRWLGRPLTPEIFDLPGTNAWLKRLAWPRMTIDKLAGILMARDDQ